MDIVLYYFYIILFLIHVAGFAGPFTARGWKQLVIRFLICIGVTVAFWFVIAQGGILVVLAFVIFLLAFASGVVAGLCTRAILLGLRWKARTGKGALVVLFGLLVTLVSFESYAFYMRAKSRALYAALPTAHTLPMIAPCDLFREAGPMFRSVITASQSDAKVQELPAHDIPIVYPAAYELTFPRMFPEKGNRLQFVSFEMYISDAQPVPPKDKTGADGKQMPWSARRPSIRFHFKQRVPIATLGARMLSILSSKPGKRDDMPEIRLASSPYPGLSLVIKPEAEGFMRGTKSFVAMNESKIEEFVQCSGRGTFPRCEFHFDESGIAIGGSFPEASLVDWATIRNHIRNFARCGIAAAKQGSG